MARIRPLGIVSVLVVASLAYAPSAGATFPGRSGAIVMSSWASPAPSPAYGNTLTFVSPRTGHARRAGLCPEDGPPGPSSLCEGAGAAALSPGGDRVAFVMAAAPTPAHAPTTYALSMLPIGGGPAVKHALIRRPQDRAFSSYTDLAWSPDELRLVLGGVEEEGPPFLSFVTPDGRLTGRVIRNASDPDWSADGRLVYSRYGSLYAGRPSGRFRLVTRRGGADPSWSPDGRRIAFVRKDGIHVVPRRGGRVRRLVKPGPRVDTFGGSPVRAYRWTEPVWSPDGKRLAFIRSFHGRRSAQLFVLTLRNRKLRRLYAGILPDEQVFSLDWRALPG